MVRELSDREVELVAGGQPATIFLSGSNLKRENDFPTGASPNAEEGLTNASVNILEHTPSFAGFSIQPKPPVR